MDTSHSITLLLASLSLVVVNPAEACQCFLLPELNYCIADYAIKARILNESEPMYPFEIQEAFLEPSELEFMAEYMEQFATHHYTFEILENYMPSKEFDDVQKVVQTNAASNLCGIRLIPGQTYVIMGWFETSRAEVTGSGSDKRVLGTNLCDVYQAADYSDSEQEDGQLSFLEDDDFDCVDVVLDFNPAIETEPVEFFPESRKLDVSPRKKSMLTKLKALGPSSKQKRLDNPLEYALQKRLEKLLLAKKRSSSSGFWWNVNREFEGTKRDTDGNLPEQVSSVKQMRRTYLKERNDKGFLLAKDNR